jgi:hypothetical protein
MDQPVEFSALSRPIDDALSQGSHRRHKWIGVLESSGSEDGKVYRIYCYGPDADRVWASIEPFVMQVTRHGGANVSLSSADGRPERRIDLSERRDHS